MAKIEIYTSPWCGYCNAARKLLDNKGVTYTEFDVMEDPLKRREMMERSGGAIDTVPQIFVDDRLLGGFNELYELDLDDALDAILGTEQ